VRRIGPDFIDYWQGLADLRREAVSVSDSGTVAREEARRRTVQHIWDRLSDTS